MLLRRLLPRESRDHGSVLKIFLAVGALLAAIRLSLLALGAGEHGRRIEAPRDEDDGALRRHRFSVAGTRAVYAPCPPLPTSDSAR